MKTGFTTALIVSLLFLLVGAGCANDTISADKALEACKDFPVSVPDKSYVLDEVTGKYKAVERSADSRKTRGECIEALMKGENPYSTE